MTEERKSGDPDEFLRTGIRGIDRLKASRGEFDVDDIRYLDQAIEIVQRLKEDAANRSDAAWETLRDTLKYLNEKVKVKVEDPEKQQK